jgi:precorrin-2 dehydrogenase / sirohydrochlorin ferrochelatase
MNNYYPVFVNLKDQPCVVVGGGKIAEGKVEGLLSANAVVTVISPALTPALHTMAEQKKFNHIERIYQRGDLNGAFMVICATDQSDINQLVWQEASENHQLVNVVDDTPRCNFIAPAILNKGDLTIAISTGGKAPAMAVRLKESLNEKIGPEYGRFLELAGQLRSPLAKHIPDFETRKALWYQILDAGVLDLLAQGHESEAVDLISNTIGFPFLPTI